MNSVNQQATTQRARGYEQTIVARHRLTLCVLTQSSGNHPGYGFTLSPHSLMLVTRVSHLGVF